MLLSDRSRSVPSERNSSSVYSSNKLERADRLFSAMVSERSEISRIFGGAQTTAVKRGCRLKWKSRERIAASELSDLLAAVEREAAASAGLLDNYLRQIGSRLKFRGRKQKNPARGRIRGEENSETGLLFTHRVSRFPMDDRQPQRGPWRTQGPACGSWEPSPSGTRFFPSIRLTDMRQWALEEPSMTLRTRMELLWLAAIFSPSDQGLKRFQE